MSIRNLLSTNLKSEQNLEVNSITTAGGGPMGPVFTDYVSNISPQLDNTGFYKNTSLYFSDVNSNTWWLESDSTNLNNPTDFPSLLLSRQGATKYGAVGLNGNDNALTLFSASATPTVSVLLSPGDGVPNPNSTPTPSAPPVESLRLEPSLITLESGATLDTNNSSLTNIGNTSFLGGSNVTYILNTTVGTGVGATSYISTPNFVVEQSFGGNPVVINTVNLNVNVSGVYRIDVIGSITFFGSTTGIATFFVGPTGTVYPNFWASNNVSPLFPGVYPCSITRFLTPADLFSIGMTNNTNGTAQFNNNATRIVITRVL